MSGKFRDWRYCKKNKYQASFVSAVVSRIVPTTFIHVSTCSNLHLYPLQWLMIMHRGFVPRGQTVDRNVHKSVQHSSVRTLDVIGLSYGQQRGGSSYTTTCISHYR